MFIFVGCAGGGSSSLFCQRIVAAINQTDPNLRATFTDVKSALNNPEGLLGDYDLLFAYGAIEAVQIHNAFDFGQIFDVILVAPQVRYLLEKKQALMADYQTVVADISGEIFGRMDGVVAFDELRGELLLIDLLREYRSSLLQASKSADKDLEILVIGADHKNPQFTQVFDQWQTQMGIRSIRQTFNLTNLLQYQPTVDFEIRFLFGAFVQLDEQTLPNIERRIDAMVVVSERPETALKQLRLKMSSAHIPVLMVNHQQSVKGSQIAELNQELLDFITLVQYQSEAAVGSTNVFKPKIKSAKKHTAFHQQFVAGTTKISLQVQIF